MSNEPIEIIDEYLELVRSLLPASLAEEVVNELRMYMIEAAEDYSGGEITLKAAKRVVAQFGAPSEVAEEYRQSIEGEEAHDPSVEPQYDTTVQRLQQRRMGEQVSYLSTYIKILVLAILWIVVTWTAVTPLVYWWPTTAAVLSPFSQLAALAFAFLILLLRRERSGKTLRRRLYDCQSGMEKILSLPENAEFEPAESVLMADVAFSVMGICGLALTLFGYFHYVGFTASPLIIMMTIRLRYVIRRIGGEDPARFSKKEFLIELAVLALLNSAIAWSVYPWHPVSGNSLLTLYSGSYSVYILFLLIIRGQHLRWEAIEIGAPDKQQEFPVEGAVVPPPVAKQLTESRDIHSLRRSIGKARITALGRAIGSYILIPIMGLIVLYLSTGEMIGPLFHSFGINYFTVILFGMIPACVFVLLYFLVRSLLVSHGERDAAFGDRSMVESVVDLLSTLLIFFSAFGFVFFELVSLLMWSSGQPPQTSAILPIWIMASLVLLLAGPLVRIGADISDLRRRNNETGLKLIVYSGWILIILCGFELGFFLVAYEYLYHLGSWLMVALVGLSFIVAQMSVATARLNQMSLAQQSEKDLTQNESFTTDLE